MRPIDGDVLYEEIITMLDDYNSDGLLNEYSVSGKELRKVLDKISKAPTLSLSEITTDTVSTN
jgi:hypothetical protein